MSQSVIYVTLGVMSQVELAGQLARRRREMVTIRRCHSRDIALIRVEAGQHARCNHIFAIAAN